MFRCGCLGVFLSIIISCLYGQRHISPVYLKNYREAEKWYHIENPTTLTDSLAFNAYLRTIVQMKTDGIITGLTIDCHLKSGILQMTGGDNAAALKSFQEAITAYHSSAQLPDSLLFQPYLYAGSIQYDFNKLDSAIFYYKQAEAISTKYPGIANAERLYNKLGALYYETGDYKRSIPYYEKAVSLAASGKPLNINLLVTYKNNIASSFLKLGAYNQALELYKQLLVYHFNEDQLYTNISIACLQQGDAGMALQFLRQVKQNGFTKYNNLSKAFIAVSKYDSAGDYNRLALNDLKKTQAARSADYALAYKYQGDIYCATGKLQEGINSYQSALLFTVPGFTDSVAAHNPTVFAGLQNFSLVFDILCAKANAFKLLQGTRNSMQNMEYALKAYSAALLLAQQVEKTYASDDARIFLKGKVNVAWAEAVSIALFLYQRTSNPAYMLTASSFVESNKASVLQAGIRQLELTGIAGMPSDLLVAEKKYKTLIAKLSIQLAGLRDSTAIATLQKKMQEEELQLSVVQEKLGDQPAWRRLQFDSRNINIDSARLYLDSKEAVLSYYYTTTQLICFYATKEESGCTVIALSPDFLIGIRQLRASLASPGLTRRQSENDITRKLYGALLSPVMEKIKNKRHLTIVPYNEICYLPFEILRDPADGSLLLKKFDIGYHYNVGFLTVPDKLAADEYKVLAMAPFTNDNSYSLLPVLPRSSDEVAGLKGQILIASAATRSQFIAFSGEFPVVHLATHAVVSDQDPLGSYIEFFAGKNAADSTHRLYEKEIYNLDMKAAKLVILSACETGNGILVNGEGVVSLSRAFSYAGCKSVITSLWKADDAATAFIIKRLHIYLHSGYTKSEALQKAKLDYLNEASIEDRYKLPAYWAHLVLIGDNAPVVRSSVSLYVPALVVAVTILIIITGIKWKRAH